MMLVNLSRQTATHLAIAMLVALSPAASQAQDVFTGNWQVDAERNGSGFLSVHRPARHVCARQVDDGCIFEWVYENTNTLIVDSRFGEMSNFGAIVQDGSISLTRGSISPRYSVLFDVVEDDALSGTWIDTFASETQSGEETWTRLEPNIDFIGVSELDDTFIDPTVVWYDPNQLVKVHADEDFRYAPEIWHNANDMPGNRPTFQITLFGQNLWGFQDITFPDAPGLQVQSQANLPVQRDDSYNDPRRGRMFRIVLWEDATPGVKTLRVNGRDYQISLDIPGFPREFQAEATLLFEGLAFDGATVEAELAFDGLRISTTTLDASLAFAGLADPNPSVNASLAFTGLGNGPAPIELPITHEDVEEDVEPE